MPGSAAMHLMEAAWANYVEPPLWVEALFSSFHEAVSPSPSQSARPHAKREIPPEVLAEIRAKQKWKNGGGNDAEDAPPENKSTAVNPKA
jgi:hypothetical protein